ncbi:hypothetical protein [Cellulomonas bogoriensis]|uniref:Transporter n=1 Tax=Cellulomonas bogoriensis 69B4 = DSM 16987 TaxID=1386082 RepID=A0A0A0BZS6_9CELL|nr:hypothetical protein [Cellulomonas bogoriensis]KGM13898.1 hypothetical protein N869_08125 [Cellulomonas bogoriensis 69B4 = DSM 16987]
MVAHLVRLKLTLLANGLRRSVWQAIGLVVVGLYALGAVAAVLLGLVGLGFADVALRHDVLVVGGSVLVLGWWLVPLVAFGADATLDPVRFVTFAVPRRDMVLGLTLAALVGVPGVFTVLVALGSGVAWWSAPAAVPVALLGALLGVLVCVLGSRALSTAMATVVGRRRFREVAIALGIVPVFLLGPILQVLGAGITSLVDVLPTVAGVLAWTPAGAPWALAGDVAAGRWAIAVLRLLVVLTAVAALAAWWGRSLDAVVDRPGQTAPAGPRRRGLGLFDRFPASPVGAVAARCATYWLRDPRYAISVVLVPLTPVLLWFVAGGQANSLMLVLGPVTGYLLGWTISADVAYDSTAFWAHVAAPVRGLDDRWGRVVAVSVLAVPLVVALTVLSALLTDRWDLLALLLAVSFGVLAVAAGVASVVSARVVYPVAAPGENPFSSKPGGGMAAFVSQGAGSLVVGGLTLPFVGLTVGAVVTGSTAMAVGAAVVAVVVGAGVLVGGVRWGGRVMDARAPELLQTLVAMR